MKNKKYKTKTIVWGIILMLILMVSLYSMITFSNNDEGEYDYCIEWRGMNNGTLKRSNLLYTCFNLAQQIFYCDYEINKNTQVLMIKAITNVTKNDEGFITSITYAEPNYFNCTRWLKSKEVK